MQPSRWLFAALLLSGCALDLDPPPTVIHARFDPVKAVIPMPTDVVRDDALGQLAIPLDSAHSDAERDLYVALNQMDGWSSAMSATVDFDGAIDPATIATRDLEVWHLGATPDRVDDVTIRVSDDRTRLTIDPPRTGWLRGERYLIVLLGGDGGVRGAAGESVDCDAAFYFLRQDQALDDPAHERAFPGDTAAERQDNARRLEELRQELAPHFAFTDGRGIDRHDIAALWSFTVTRRVELAMDKPSQRMPLPIDLLLDPATGGVDLPVAAWDSDTVRNAKARLAGLDGFGVSQNLMLEATGPLDPATVDGAVELWRTDGAGGPARVEASTVLLPDQHSLEVTPLSKPLAEASHYAVVVRDQLRDADGGALALMPAGHLLLGHAPVAGGGASLVGAVDDVDAVRLEAVRSALADFLDRRGRDGALAGWTYTTMTTRAPIKAWMDQPATLAVPANPTVTRRQSMTQALVEFPLAIGSLFQVAEVVHGTIKSPEFLDPETRAMRQDGGHTVDDIPFTMTLPRGIEAGSKVPVVIFGHAIMTERRMVLAIGGALAARGFATVSIDLPFHGSRTYCWSEGPLTIPSPTTGELTNGADPCQSGDTCSEDGRCRDASGAVQPPRMWPVIPMPMSSGAAFIEIEKISNTRDHFIQSEIDLAALLRSLREGDWSEVLGAPVDGEHIRYAGQSLGGILGATFVALEPDITDAVLNVPGADTVDLFRESPFFGGQIAAFFRREGVDPDSFDGHRFLNVARWFMDAADPQSFADTLADGGRRRVLLQMALLDAIIPNTYTEILETLAGVPRKNYVAEHGFLVIPIEPEYLRGVRDLAAFLDGEAP
jgi:hypothetical protein